MWFLVVLSLWSSNPTGVEMFASGPQTFEACTVLHAKVERQVRHLIRTQTDTGMGTLHSALVRCVRMDEDNR